MLWGWGWRAEESQAKGAVRLQKSVATLIYANVKYIKGVENILINIVDSEELFLIAPMPVRYVTTLPSRSLRRKYIMGTSASFRVVFWGMPASANHASLKHICWHSQN